MARFMGMFVISFYTWTQHVNPGGLLAHRDGCVRYVLAQLDDCMFLLFDLHFQHILQHEGLGNTV